MANSGDYYRAVFKAHDKDIQRAKHEFIQEFGEVVYLSNIAPFIERHGVGYIWAAGNSIFANWFILKLVSLSSRRHNREYSIPRLDGRTETFIECKICGVEFAQRFADAATRCPMCVADQSARETEEFTEKMQDAIKNHVPIHINPPCT